MHKRQKGGIEIITLLLIFAVSFILAGGFLTFKKTSSSFTPGNIDTSNINADAQKTLQLMTLPTITPRTPPPGTINPNPTPTPTAPPGPVGPPVTFVAPTPPPVQAPPPATPPSSSAPWSCQTPFEIRNCSCMTVYTDGHRITCPSGQPSNMARVVDCTDILNQQDPSCVMTPDRQKRGCTSECYAKPVIYLYPVIPTLVSVSIETSGQIIVSDPIYPKDGWKDVLAFPNGTLFYQQKLYNELFYETDVKKTDPPKTGIIVDSKNIKNSLYALTKSLGLIKPEQDELVDYWLPRLESLNKKYIFISLIDKQTKEKNDKVIISPKPDTRIEFILYFKGLDNKIKVAPLALPQNPPQRIGFTAVEWGGTIATE